MKDWKNNERVMSEKKSCRRCLTSRGLRKIKDAAGKARRTLRKLWFDKDKDK